MYNDFYQEEELMASLSSFEEAIEHNEAKYFEVHEFEFIIDHYMNSNDLLNSKKAIKKALKIHPKSHELKKKLAQVYNMDRQFEKARVVLREAFDAFGASSDVDYYLILGEAYLGSEQIEKAEIAFNKALELAEDDYFDIATSIAAYFQQEEYFEETIHYLKKVVDEDSTLLFDIALAYQSLSEYNQAIIHFRKFVEFAPFSIDAWYYLSKSYQLAKEFEKAEDAMLNAIALDPEMLIYQYDLAKIYVEANAFLKALDVYKDLLAKDRDVNHTIFLSIGDICYNIEEYENAKKNYEIALRLNPESADAYHSLGQVEIVLENYDIARSFIQKSIAIDSKRADFFASLGSVFLFLGDEINSEKAFLESILLDPHYETGWHLLIDHYYYANQIEKALEMAFKALEKIVETPILNSKISAIYFDLDNEELGLMFLKKALKAEKTIFEFFLDFYQEGKENFKIMNLIHLYQ